MFRRSFASLLLLAVASIAPTQAQTVTTDQTKQRAFAKEVYHKINDIRLVPQNYPQKLAGISKLKVGLIWSDLLAKSAAAQLKLTSNPTDFGMAYPHRGEWNVNAVYDSPSSTTPNAFKTVSQIVNSIKANVRPANNPEKYLYVGVAFGPSGLSNDPDGKRLGKVRIHFCNYDQMMRIGTFYKPNATEQASLTNDLFNDLNWIREKPGEVATEFERLKKERITSMGWDTAKLDTAIRGLKARTKLPLLKRSTQLNASAANVFTATNYSEWYAKVGSQGTDYSYLEAWYDPYYTATGTTPTKPWPRYALVRWACSDPTGFLSGTSDSLAFAAGTAFGYPTYADRKDNQANRGAFQTHGVTYDQWRRIAKYTKLSSADRRKLEGELVGELNFVRDAPKSFRKRLLEKRSLVQRLGWNVANLDSAIASLENAKKLNSLTRTPLFDYEAYRVLQRQKFAGWPTNVTAPAPNDWVGPAVYDDVKSTDKPPASLMVIKWVTEGKLSDIRSTNNTVIGAHFGYPSFSDWNDNEENIGFFQVMHGNQDQLLATMKGKPFDARLRAGRPTLSNSNNEWVPQIVAASDNSKNLHVAWRDQGQNKIHIAKYTSTAISGATSLPVAKGTTTATRLAAKTSAASIDAIANGNAANLVGFAIDGAGTNRYVLFGKDEYISFKAKPQNQYRTDALRLAKVGATSGWPKNLDTKSYSDSQFYQPLAGGTGRMTLGNSQLAFILGRNTEIDTGLNPDERHQQALRRSIDTAGNAVVTSGGYHGHSFNQRIYFDGTHFVTLDRNEWGILLGKWEAKSGISSAGSSRPIYTRPLYKQEVKSYLGNVRLGANGYVVLFASEKGSATSQLYNGPRNLAVVHVVKDFDKKPYHEFFPFTSSDRRIWINSDVVDTKVGHKVGTKPIAGNPKATGDETFPTDPQDPVSVELGSKDKNKIDPKLEQLVTKNGKPHVQTSVRAWKRTGVAWLTNYVGKTGIKQPYYSAERPKLVKLSNNSYIAIWEQWVYTKLANGTGNKPVDSVLRQYHSTWAMKIDEYGRQTKAPTNIGKPIRLPQNDDAFLLGGKAAWVTGEIIGRKLLLHTLDSTTLQVTTKGLAL